MQVLHFNQHLISHANVMNMMYVSIVIMFVPGGFYAYGGEETGRRDEGWGELSQPLLPEPLQRRLQAGRHRYAATLPLRCPVLVTHS